ncbi:motility associated factor glycosyltransferase family protein [Desulfohalovibrio reitneri]|uniref:motility associated factor glycosyltransferase family protein n=1 Tax=Desulfohalovibrio reitneri TaxID=1307759 RepID=UPI0004A71334|nr:6-hydroxymethylpterin diphosphokinase MptE-like protein [Desulfohalovibrio reitneri]
MQLYAYLKQNVEALRSANPAVFAWLQAREYDMSDLSDRVFVNESGVLDWRLPGGQGLFEPIPPATYYRGWTYTDRADTSATLLVGCNVGYGLNHVLTSTPESHKIVVLEPRPELLLACLGQTDYTEFIASGRLHFMPPNEEYLAELIRHLDLQFLFGKVLLREDVPSRQIGPEYARWVNRCKARLENFTVEMTTLRLRQDTMVGNELNNFQRAVSDGSLSCLQGSAKGLTAVLFGAGPSLSENAARFRENPHGALYATSLQALPALLSHGIQPHFCLAIDYSEGMLNIFDKLDHERAANVPLIYSTKVQPELLERYPGPTLPLWTQGGISTFVMKDKEYVIDAGGNVGVTLLRFLEWLGAERMLLVGQDFGCPGDRTHAEGHHGQRALDGNKQYTRQVKDASGNAIATSPQLIAARRDMEDDLARLPLRVCNLYGGGAVIKGAEMVDWETIENERLLRSSAPEAVDAVLGKLEQAGRSCRRPAFEHRSHRWTTSLRNVEKRLHKLFKHLDRNQYEINQTLRQIGTFLKQDPLYTPYLFNEIMDVAGFVHATREYRRADFVPIRDILKRAVNKVRHMDRMLCVETTKNSGQSQAA